MSELKTLVKKRSSMKCKLTIVCNYIKLIKSLSHLQIIDLECRLRKLEPLCEEFDALQTEIEILSDEPQAEEVPVEREQFDNDYFSLVATAKSLLAAGGRIREGSVTNFSDAESGAQVRNLVRLPKIDLPHFSGGYQNWLEFKDTFLSLIHNSECIDNINKFHYLRASLQGSAALIIKNIDFKSDNYKIAWQLLCERFDNSRLLVNNHIQALFNVDHIRTESCKSIRYLIDVTNKNIRALTSLKEPTQYWDSLVIYMMSTKLDGVTGREWEEHRNTFTCSPTLAQFITFLSNRADLLETLEENNAS
ncbi:Gag-pol polyprotein [Operophtera brumata]|uniref:Gag-pol polyprotein n=1 Tax=Operophtera brumata TaxID=104452 RepID=A0A0L7LCW4_OPEBR|nr:Gag-pol polyprotein [Operophtera brumata]